MNDMVKRNEVISRIEDKILELKESADRYWKMAEKIEEAGDSVLADKYKVREMEMISKVVMLGFLIQDIESL